MSSIDGLVSGLDTSAIINALMSSERTSQNALKAKRTKVQSRLSGYQTLNAKILAIKTAAQNLNSITKLAPAKATSSKADSVVATASEGALPGNLSFLVKQLAQAHSIASFGTVASTSTVVASGPVVLGKAGNLGIYQFDASNLAVGSHVLEVTQASAGAAQNGTTAVADSVVIDGTNNTLQITANGSPQTITLAAGTYNQRTLAAEITRASGGTVNAEVNADKTLKLSTTREGSAASLQITGGTGLGALGLVAGGASSGIDGILTLNGVSNTLTDIRPDRATSANIVGTGTETMALEFQGGLRIGTSTIKSIDQGDGSLGAVVSAINAANLGIAASAVQVADGQFKLAMASNSTGKAGAITYDADFSAGLGLMSETTNAQDAVLTVGSGVNGYEITRSSNTITGVLQNVTLSLLKADPTQTIDISVSRDDAALADKVDAVIKTMNEAIGYIRDQTKYNIATKSSSLFQGDFTFTSVKSDITTALISTVAESSLKNASSVGITLNNDGTITFDKTKFTTAYTADPEGVATLLFEGGTTGTSAATESPGFIERLITTVDAATNSVTGRITSAIKGRESATKSLDDSIAAWDVRLAKRETSLRRTYSNLETQMQKYRSLGSQLMSSLGGPR